MAGKNSNRNRGVVCNECNRKFTSKAALAQHKASCVRPSRSQRRGGMRGRRRSVLRRNQWGLDVAPSRTKSVPGQSIRAVGEDRLDIFPVSPKNPLFKSYAIDTGASLRLSSLSQAFQRVRWDSVVVRVVPQAPLTTKGGYVCGFIMDPSDTAVTARELSAAQGSITKKWYESSVVRMPPKRELLYSSAGEDPRLSIPANFWVISEGNPSDAIDVVLTLEWSVTLMEPTVEHRKDLSFVTGLEIIPEQGKLALSWRNCGNNSSSDWDQSGLIDVLKAATAGNVTAFWRVPSYSFEYAEGTGDTGTIQAHFIGYDPKSKVMQPSANGRDFDVTKVWQSNVDIQVLVPIGTYCKFVGTTACVNSFRQGSQQSSPCTSTNLEQSKELCQDLLLGMQRLLHSSPELAKTLSEDWEILIKE